MAQETRSSASLRAQNGGGLPSRKTVGLTVPEAAEVHRSPNSLVAPRTLELEQGAVKHLSKHLVGVTLAKASTELG